MYFWKFFGVKIYNRLLTNTFFQNGISEFLISDNEKHTYLNKPMTFCYHQALKS